MTLTVEPGHNTVRLTSAQVHQAIAAYVLQHTGRTLHCLSHVSCIERDIFGHKIVHMLDVEIELEPERKA